MDTHFTYSSKQLDSTTLQQGDILAKTEELVALIEKVHPHYANDDYTHFQVLTQSCDLVRRGKKCAARYITIAAVRSLKTVIRRTIETEVAENKRIKLDKLEWCNDKHKSRVSHIVGALFNNNDKNHFFLKEFPDRGLLEDSCTFLHLSIAIKAYEHYDLCLNAKIIELDSNFQSKLGWLVGNLYSRVGTEDFAQACFESQEDFQSYIEKILNNHIAWVQSDQFPEFRSAYDADIEQTGKQLMDEAESKLQAKRQARLNSFVALIEQAKIIEPGKKQTLKNLLDSNRAKRYLNI